MQKFTIFLLITIISLGIGSSVEASYTCDDMENWNYSYCAYIAGPDNVNKYVKFIEDGRVAISYCMNSNTESVSNLINNLKNKLHVVGASSTIEYYQCDTMNCDYQRLLGTDQVTVKSNRTLDHSKFSVTLLPSYGDSDCNPKEDNVNIIHAMTVSQCSKSFYCARVINPETVKKYVKVVNNGYSMTRCMNKQVGFAANEQLQPGFVKFYQCDSIKCYNQKLLEQDFINGSLNGTSKPDHPQFSITLDPAYGEDCDVEIPS